MKQSLLNRMTTSAISLLLTWGLSLSNGWFCHSFAVEISTAQIHRQVVAHVKEKLQTQINPADQPFITVEVLNIPTSPLNFPQVTEPNAVKIRMDSRLGEMYSDRAIVQVYLQSPTGENREMGVPVHISIKKPVWVSKHSISAHQPLKASDFSLQTKDVGYNYRYVVGQETPLANYEARVNLQADEVLDNRKILIPPDVTYNADVRIQLSSANGMTLTVPGVAMASGRIGETIRVRQSIYQHRYYNAKIIDKSLVLVEI
jgi:flagella basal body P-ring formation protein FlgA